MATATHTLTRSVSTGGPNVITQTQSFVGSGEANIIDEVIADSVTDQLAVISIDVSAIKCIYLHATTNLTVETNDGGTPIDTIALLANDPYIFYIGSLNANKLTTDVTGLFLTNASGGSCTFNLRCVYDASP